MLGSRPPDWVSQWGLPGTTALAWDSCSIIVVKTGSLLMLKVLIVGSGGFLGAIIRYGVSGFAYQRFKGGFPAGTLMVNVIGCFIIGVLMCLIEKKQFASPALREFMIIGILGSFTTFSTMGYETFELIRNCDYASALLNISANLFIGIAAVALGWFAA